MKIYNKIITKMWGTHFCEILFLYIYIYIYAHTHTFQMIQYFQAHTVQRVQYLFKHVFIKKYLLTNLFDQKYSNNMSFIPLMVKLIFLAAITPAFSVMWSFRNHSIYWWYSFFRILQNKNISDHYKCVLLSLLWHQFYASLLNKSILNPCASIKKSWT